MLLSRKLHIFKERGIHGKGEQFTGSESFFSGFKRQQTFSSSLQLNLNFPLD